MSEPQKDRIMSELQKLDGCEHSHTETRSRGVHFCKQCTRCGRMVGQWMKKADIENPDTVKPFDENLRDNYERTVNELRLALSAKLREEKSHRWHMEYENHLASRKWEEKRRLVMNRCGGICEGCGVASAEEVHHVTYESYNKIGEEFLFELVGLCRSCHEKIHMVER